MSDDQLNAEAADVRASPASDFGITAGTWRTLWVLMICASAVVASAVQIALDRADDGLFAIVLAVAVCGVAAWFDAGTMRVPNPLTYTAILIGLGLSAVVQSCDAAGWTIVNRWIGAPGAVESLQGFGLCAAMGLGCMLLANMGGGDMKLMAAIGAMLGYEATLPVLFNMLSIAAVLAVVNLIWTGRLTAGVQFVAYSLLTLYFLKQRLPEPPPRSRHMPLAVPMLLGLITAQFYPFYTPVL